MIFLTQAKRHSKWTTALSLLHSRWAEGENTLMISPDVVSLRAGEEQAHFLTVDWCNQGKRGIFCNAEGHCFRKDVAHTEDEMNDILGAFDLVLAPESMLLTVSQLEKFTQWIPLAEYSYMYGIALEPREKGE